jgi:hypothetical protein
MKASFALHLGHLVVDVFHLRLLTVLVHLDVNRQSDLND